MKSLRFHQIKAIIIQGVNAEQTVPIIKIRLKGYDEEYKIEVASFSASCNILGIKEIHNIFPTFLNFKRIPRFHSNLAEVKIEPVVLPKTKPSFTSQYPIKGGIEEITKTIKNMIKEGIIEQTQSFNYNSPVWPVQKPNGKWRLTVDYRKINENTEKLPGSLPDIDNITTRIKTFAPLWLATIDLTDMFFGIPIHPNSREITTFTWQGKQYQFLRLPQGYLNSPIIAHSTLMISLKDFEAKDVEILTYVDDILVMGKEEKQVKETLDKLILHLQTWGWTINKEKVHGPSKQVKFLGIHWTTEGPQIPEQIIDKLNL